jgi:ribosomal protein L11 methyltransferase
MNLLMIILSKKSNKINWNEEWERNFEALMLMEITYAPLFTQNRCRIRYCYQTKMSFGTGHHDNTYDDPAFIRNRCYRNENAGCGDAETAILAILRRKEHNH